MQDVQVASDTSRQTQVRGAALIVASVVGGVMMLGALWAAKVDLDSKLERNALPMDLFAAAYKILIAASLLVVAHRLASRSLRLLAVLMAALAVGSFLINLDVFGDAVHRVTSLVFDSLPVSSGSMGLAFSFVALAVVAGWLVVAAYLHARAEERKVVLTLIGLLFVLGVFVGPVNAISSLGINREWLFAEDFGQVVTLAVLGGYVAGLLVGTWSREGSGPR